MVEDFSSSTHDPAPIDGFKPLMVAETDQFVAIATEEIALRRTLGEDFVVYEPAPGSVGIWHTQQPALVST